ncbi:MAG: AraC family transcriptional regulator [Lawsonibacter sp.]|nr:AraC family transcriptional regulator [Lawsonibacter sp.]
MNGRTKKGLLVTQQPLWNIVFDEQRFLLDPSGHPIAQLASFREPTPGHSFCFPGIGMVGIRFAAGGSDPSAYCYGVLQKPDHVQMDEIRKGFYARMYPGEFSKLFGIPTAEISPYGIPLENLMSVKPYLDVIAATNTIEEFQTLFCRMVQSIRTEEHRDELHERVVAYMVQTILRQPDEVSLDSIVQQTGYSRRHINNLFHRYVGAAPKQLSDQIRFQRAMQACLTSETNLSSIASEFGYYDQSHFNREFRAFSSMSPHELKNLIAERDSGFQAP